MIDAASPTQLTDTTRARPATTSARLHLNARWDEELPLLDAATRHGVDTEFESALFNVELTRLEVWFVHGEYGAAERGLRALLARPADDVVQLMATATGVLAQVLVRTGDLEAAAV